MAPTSKVAAAKSKPRSEEELKTDRLAALARWRANEKGIVHIYLSSFNVSCFLAKRAAGVAARAKGFANWIAKQRGWLFDSLYYILNFLFS